MTERVNHPPHYTHPSGIECIEIVRHENFNRGNAIKYVMRAGKKEGSDELEDLRKALWYIRDEILRLTGGEVEQHPLVERLRRDLDVMTADRDSYREQVFAAAARETEKIVAEYEPEPVAVPAPLDWDDAPNWAWWWAVDQNGTAWWFSDEPTPNRAFGFWYLKKLGARHAPVHPESVDFHYASSAEGRIQLGDYPWFNTKRVRGDYGV